MQVNSVTYAQGDRSADANEPDRPAAAIHRFTDVLEKAIARGLGGGHGPLDKAAPLRFPRVALGMVLA